MLSRLRDGVSLEQARVAVAAQAERIAAQFPEIHKNQRALVYPEPRARMESSAITYMPPMVTVFMTLTGLVLLVAWPTSPICCWLAPPAGRKRWRFAPPWGPRAGASRGRC